jgi:Rad3-related DNA helicase
VFIKLRKEAGGTKAVWREQPAELAEALELFSAQAERELTADSAEGDPQLLEVYFAAHNYLRIGKLYDDCYVSYAEISRNEVRVKLFCLHPARLLRQMGKGYRSHVYFSATLSPLGYYMEVLGADAEDYTVSLPSPFDSGQWEVTIQPISTRFADRERTLAPLVNVLQRKVAERPGNYFFFFPSYEYMNAVYETFVGANQEIRTLLQTPGMAEEEREAYLAAFTAEREGTFVGFAVMGGIFSESIDLVGDRLRGVAVVGVGMPQIGLERNLIREYYNEEGRNGFDYAYVYPGMNKVLQAGGRLIRSEQDRGVLVLIDDRYLQPQYLRLLPEEWTAGLEAKNPQTVPRH